MYKITFLDGIIFEGGNPENSKWLFSPNKPIQKLEYKFLGSLITLENYEAYNHLVERVAFLQGKGQRITKVILMVKKGNDVMKLIYDLKRGQIYSDVALFGHEYQGKPCSGWKVGIIGRKPKASFR